MDFGVKGFHSAIHHLREAGVIRHLDDGNALGSK